MDTAQTAQQLAPHIPVTALNPVELVTQARRNANSPSLTAKIVVNFIRHKLTTYDKLMDATRSHANGFEERAILRRAVLLAIVRQYGHMPLIVTEAKRQLDQVIEADAPQPIRVWKAI